MRRTKPVKREVLPDSRYNSVLVTMFINRMMYSGKKSVALRNFYDAMDLVEARAKRSAIDVFEQALANVSPAIEVKPRRVGGSTYQVPVEVEPERQRVLAMRWLIAASRARAGKSYSEKLAGEVLDAANNTGGAVKRREETHKMAEANRAFAHFRF